MNEFSFSNVLDQAWELTKKHGLLIAVIFFVICLITNGVQTLCLPAGAIEEYINAIQNNPQDLQDIIRGSNGMWQGSFIGEFVNWILMTGLFAMALNITKGILDKPDFSAYKMDVMIYVKYFGVELLYSIIMAIGFMCCIVPGIYLMVRLQFVTLAVLDDPDCGIGDAFTRSWNMTRGNFWTLLGLIITFIICLIVGVCCCCIGYFFAFAFGIFMSTVAYCMLKPQPEVIEEPATEPEA